MESLKKRKKVLICLFVAGAAIAVVIGILIYADFSCSFFVVPLVVDERVDWQPLGPALKIWEFISRIKK